jgi:hypothetical protein
MKKILGIATVIMVLASCGNSSEQTGVDDDGIKTVDSNGGLADTLNRNNTAPTDTAAGENRVDLSNRDTFKR